MPAQTDLFLAARRNDVVLAKQALEEGADIALHDNQQRTVVHGVWL